LFDFVNISSPTIDVFTLHTYVPVVAPPGHYCYSDDFYAVRIKTGRARITRTSGRSVARRHLAGTKTWRTWHPRSPVPSVWPNGARYISTKTICPGLLSRRRGWNYGNKNCPAPLKYQYSKAETVCPWYTIVGRFDDCQWARCQNRSICTLFADISFTETARRRPENVDRTLIYKISSARGDFFFINYYELPVSKTIFRYILFRDVFNAFYSIFVIVFILSLA